MSVIRKHERMGRRLRPSWHGMTRTCKDATSERGSTMVEFALVLTILLTLVFGIMDFSRAMYAYHFISNAAREATRYASVRGTTFPSTCGSPPPVGYACQAATSGADITAYVSYIVAPGMNVSSTTFSTACSNPPVGQLYVCATWPGTSPTGTCSTSKGNNSPGCLVKVQLNYTYGFTLPFVSQDISSITLTSTSETVIQQ